MTSAFKATKTNFGKISHHFKVYWQVLRHHYLLYKWWISEPLTVYAS